MTRENAELLTTLRDMANCAATILDMFVKLRQEPSRTQAPTDTDEDDEPAPARPPQPRGAEAPTSTHTNQEPRHAEAPMDANEGDEPHRNDPLPDDIVEPRAPFLMSTITCPDCGCPQPDVLPDELQGSACELCTIAAALHRERQRRYEAARSSVEAVCAQIHDLTELTYAALTTDGHRTLPTLDAELSRLVHAYRDRTGPFARPERGVRA